MYLSRCSTSGDVSSHRYCPQIPPLFQIDYNLRRWLLSSSYFSYFYHSGLTLIFLYILSSYKALLSLFYHFLFYCLVVICLSFLFSVVWLNCFYSLFVSTFQSSPFCCWCWRLYDCDGWWSAECVDVGRTLKGHGSAGRSERLTFLLANCSI